jgi:succinate-acetate transporter protein
MKYLGLFFRKNQQSLEECFWEAWACLISSSTHLRQKTRIERVLGFFLAIWGILFYSRLLSATTEQFRVSYLFENIQNRGEEH